MHKINPAVIVSAVRADMEPCYSSENSYVSEERNLGDFAQEPGCKNTMLGIELKA